MLISCPEYYMRIVAERMDLLMKVAPDAETRSLLDEMGGPTDVLQHYIGAVARRNAATSTARVYPQHTHTRSRQISICRPTCGQRLCGSDC